MFTTHETIIDTIQTGKKQIVNTFVTDVKFRGELIKLIDAQTEFAKGSVKSSLAIAEAMLSHVQNNMKAFVPTYTK